jgi:gluconate 5-dehydrogenase
VVDDDMTSDRDWLGLRDSRVLIAGAGGLGAACTAAFLAAGARVQVVDADAERAGAAIVGAPPDRAAAAGADLRQPGEAVRAVSGICQRWGGIDVCVHAVGMNVRKPVLECDDTEWAATLDVNLTTAWLLCREAGRRMTEAGHGSIVLFSSVSGLLAHKDHAPYAATKGAVNQMMRVMAAEWAPRGVTVNAVAPGYVETGLTRAYLGRDGNRARLEGLVPAGRLSTPEEVAGPVLFLASRQARYVTGHVLYVDGGRTLV